MTTPHCKEGWKSEVFRWPGRTPDENVSTREKKDEQILGNYEQYFARVNTYRYRWGGERKKAWLFVSFTDTG